jgi:hypothetical protein
MPFFHVTVQCRSSSTTKRGSMLAKFLSTGRAFSCVTIKKPVEFSQNKDRVTTVE